MKRKFMRGLSALLCLVLTMSGIPVIAEYDDENDCNRMFGRTETDILVRFEKDGHDIKAGDTVSVKIDKALNWAIFGKIMLP